MHYDYDYDMQSRDVFVKMFSAKLTFVCADLTCVMIMIWNRWIMFLSKCLTWSQHLFLWIWHALRLWYGIEGLCFSTYPFDQSPEQVIFCTAYLPREDWLIWPFTTLIWKVSWPWSIVYSRLSGAISGMPFWHFVYLDSLHDCITCVTQVVI